MNRERSGAGLSPYVRLNLLGKSWMRIFRRVVTYPHPLRNLTVECQSDSSVFLILIHATWKVKTSCLAKWTQLRNSGGRAWDPHASPGVPVSRQMWPVFCPPGIQHHILKPQQKEKVTHCQPVQSLRFFTHWHFGNEAPLAWIISLFQIFSILNNYCHTLCSVIQHKRNLELGCVL